MDKWPGPYNRKTIIFYQCRKCVDMVFKWYQLRFKAEDKMDQVPGTFTGYLTQPG